MINFQVNYQADELLYKDYKICYDLKNRVRKISMAVYNQDNIFCFTNFKDSLLPKKRIRHYEYVFDFMRFFLFCQHVVFKALAKLANIGWQPLLFVSEALAMNKKVTPDLDENNSVWQAMLASFARS